MQSSTFMRFAPSSFPSPFHFATVTVCSHSLFSFEKLSDWMMIAPQEVENTKEGRTLRMVHSSFASALRFLHPDLDWNSSPLNEQEFHLRLLDGIKHKLDITQVKLTPLLLFLPPSLSHSHLFFVQDWDWYFINNEEFMIPHGGHTLLLHYGSLFKMLKSLHPNIDWDESKFLMMGDKSFWDLKSNRRALMDLIAQQLNIHQVK